ncbi:unnamed protein product [Gemmataceae bacterium]|nr:unnamed protein product [Gemmataceae bacterium]VTU01009.1 unnamed protein product [Gemmataceae bacterium]
MRCPVPDLTESIETLTETIVTEAALPLKSEADGQSAQGRSLDELMRVRDKLKAETAGKKSAWGRVKMARAVPPGAT